MDKMVVIARYNEDVSWTKNLSCGYVVCNKGKQIPLQGNVIEMQNFGRESETYLNFIISNYGKIKDEHVYCFLQGSPFDHGITIEEINNVTTKGFSPLGNIKFQEGLKGSVNNYFPNGIPVIEYCDMFFKTNPFIDKGKIEFIRGGQFVVTGKRIKNRSVYFYQYLYINLIKPNPLEGHIMERIWNIVFDDSIEDRVTAYQNKRIKALVGANWGGPIT